MRTPSGQRLNAEKTSGVSTERKTAPILQISRICCALIAGAGLFISTDAWIIRRFQKPFPAPQQAESLLIPLAVLMLAGAALCIVRIMRQSGLDARKSAELLQETKQRATEIAALYDTSQDISVQKHPPVILQSIVERAKSLLNTAGGAIFLHDKTQNDFQIAVELGVGMPIGTHLPLNEGLAGRVECFGTAYEISKTAAAVASEKREEYFRRIHSEDRGRVQAAIAAHLQIDKPFSEEYRIVDENNSYITVLDRGTAIRNPGGKPIKLIGAISNITERKQAEQMKTDFVSAFRFVLALQPRSA